MYTLFDPSSTVVRLRFDKRASRSKDSRSRVEELSNNSRTLPEHFPNTSATLPEYFLNQVQDDKLNIT